jgi:hypothetical protein
MLSTLLSGFRYRDAISAESVGQEIKIIKKIVLVG